MVRFYTYSPEIDYPYVLRNIKQKYLTSTIHEIVDIGIYDLLKSPNIHSKSKLETWVNLKSLGWKVIPDCPDIHKEFNVISEIDNIEYSKELLLKYYNPEGKNLLPVIQGYYHSVASFEEYMRWFLKEFPSPSQIAIGTCCKASKKRIVIETIKLARVYFPISWIHIFGLKMNHLIDVLPYINSWDSMSWTFPRQPNKSSARTKLERIKYFAEYIGSLDRFLEVES